jgi:hypothetical protein
MHYTYKYIGKEIIIAFENLKRSYKKVTEKSQNNSIIFSDRDNTLNQRVDVGLYIYVGGPIHNTYFKVLDKDMMYKLICVIFLNLIFSRA